MTRSSARRLVDPYREADLQPDAAQFIQRLEERGRAPSHARLRRRFLRFARVERGATVLEVGSGSGVVCRDLARMVGPEGEVVGTDPSRTFVAAARLLARREGLDRIRFRVAPGERLPFRAGRFDRTVALTVFLHVDRPEAVLAEMIRVTRAGGIVGVQDQDLGTVALAHPDPALTTRILSGVAERLYVEPLSGRRLPGLLGAAGLRHVRLRTDVYQDTTLEPYTRTFLERRAESAVRLGLVGPAAVQRWLDDLTDLDRTGGFVMTMTFFGVVGVK